MGGRWGFEITPRRDSFALKSYSLCSFNICVISIYLCTNLFFIICNIQLYCISIIFNAIIQSILSPSVTVNLLRGY